MNRKALLVSVLATIAGIVSLRLYMQRFEQEVRGGPTTQVLVLVKDVPAGTRITRDLLGTRALPQAYLESRHIPARDLDKVRGARLGVAGRANEALLFSDLASMREPPRQLSSLVPEGMRAFSLELRDGGFDALLSPGDRVDVLLARAQEREAEPSQGVQTIAQNLLVLAVGQDLGGIDPARGPEGARSGQVTLSVTPAQGARLAQAEGRGELRLFLRNPDDVARSDRAVDLATTVRAPGED